MADSRLLETELNFQGFSNIIDSRLLRALADLGFARPTLVQSKAIPLALEGKDILARARTGSGKTAAYCIPIVQKILNSKTVGNAHQATRAVVLVPTRELADQVTKYLKGLLAYCDKEVNAVNIAGGSSVHVQRMVLAEKPDLIVATPSRLLALIQSKSLVIDEADLILSYGHDGDVKQILSGGYLPKLYQTFLMSATMTKDVETLKGIALRNPAILKLEECEDEAANLAQYAVRCSEVDKFLLIYVILKLKLVKGKCLIFVNNVDRGYRVKLFLEQFSIKSCVLNSELPLNTRFHIVQEFNKGVYDYIIATDETGGKHEDQDTDDEEEEEDGDEQDDDAGEEQGPAVNSDLIATELDTSAGPSSSTKRKRAAPPQPKKSKKHRTVRKDKEFGVSRGIDFVDVACVLNFDFPRSSRAYTHRVGRTARAGRSGMALSFVTPKSEFGKDKVLSCPTGERDEMIFTRVEQEQGARGSKIKDYAFDMAQVEAFRYRMEDALRAVTRAAVREARIKELKAELLNSEKLKTHFEENPLDLEYIRHDKALHPSRVQAHMKHVPKYLMPRIASAVDEPEKNNVGFVPFKKPGSRGRGKGRGGVKGGRKSGGRGGKKMSDPLKNFGR
ncbi:ATP-dependent RNA helicase [Ceratobasidium theobromae]|uniref:RNA helicase n=1 Tax=Ceratobasidium theobromae TaxID=1582974 RepID=A0A5N5QT28_9AGAM|nr:ATP-dependent RNA helicase [Ceratobasidium theobromae]